MSSNDITDTGSEEAALSSANVTTQTAAVVKPKTHPLLGEDGDEWEGFYEEGDWEEL